jgi:hypothetical protein
MPELEPEEQTSQEEAALEEEHPWTWADTILLPVLPFFFIGWVVYQLLKALPKVSEVILYDLLMSMFDSND